MVEGGENDRTMQREKMETTELFLILQPAEFAWQSLLFTWDQLDGIMQRQHESFHSTSALCLRYQACDHMKYTEVTQ